MWFNSQFVTAGFYITFVDVYTYKKNLDFEKS